MRFVLFSDLHLEAELGASQDAARRTRTALRATLCNILSLVEEVAADAVLCAGDLYERTAIRPDTGDFLGRAFESIAPVSVYNAPGNHDCLDPDSLYRRTPWSSNVHIFTETTLQPIQLDDGLTLWGGAHLSPAGAVGFLDGFHVSGKGVHLALFHGSESSGMAYEGPDDNAEFSADDIPASGLHHAFVGHYHEHQDADFYTYAGNPYPLTEDENGQTGSTLRGAVVVDVRPDGHVERMRHRVANDEAIA